MEFKKLKTIVTSKGVVDLQEVAGIQENTMDTDYTRFLDKRSNTILIVDKSYAEVIKFMKENQDKEIAYLGSEFI